ncbi:hypothetical protein CEXT_381491 [Caerostris extrusa]|uniref:Uncharacterized protein n=1 Tax=Caerostris extrusa TaxID=172846 RepID=A0AAV4XUN9_CAEEX|nr:hypothetical protein CEXT_381491 [Caerostris extrusa]
MGDGDTFNNNMISVGGLGRVLQWDHQWKIFFNVSGVNNNDRSLWKFPHTENAPRNEYPHTIRVYKRPVCSTFR